METLIGTGSADGVRVGIVVSTYNDFVTCKLRDGAIDALRAAGVPEHRIVVAMVPGAFEIPQAARRLAAGGAVDAVIGLGCLIRGETPHFDIIASAVAQGITTAAIESGVPMTFGVLTTNSAEEALARAEPGSSNKGWEAADAAIAMTSLFRKLPLPACPEHTG